MKVIITIKRGNKDHENFTREIEITPQECEYLKDAARIINYKGNENLIGVYVRQI